MSEQEVSRGPAIKAVVVTFVTLIVITTILRVYTRLRIVKLFGADDWWMLVAVVSNILFSAGTLTSIHYGNGRHVQYISKDGFPKALMWWWLCYPVYCICMIAAKISIGFFLLRLTVKPIQNAFLYIALGASIAIGLVFLFVAMFQCWPMSFFWDRTIPGGKCINVDALIGLTYLYSTISILTDFTYAILPVFLVWKLNMSRRTRLVLIPIFGMACVASVAVVIRLPYLKELKSPDFLFAASFIAIWSMVEQGLAIMAGNLATLRPLVRHLSTKFGYDNTDVSDPSKAQKSVLRRAKQWSGDMNKRGKKCAILPSFLNPFKKSNKPSPSTNDGPYGLGSLQPTRIPEDPSADYVSQMSEKELNKWRAQPGRISDEECAPGTITMHSEIRQTVEKV